MSKSNSKSSTKPVSASASKSAADEKPLVGVVMGSDTDWGTMKLASDALRELDIPHEVRVVSAHRTPEDMAGYATSARKRGLLGIVAGAGGAAHLPGMLASYTTWPVVGVPVDVTALHGVDALHSIVQMPAGVPVATVGIGTARNAGLLAARILGATSPEIAAKLDALRTSMAEASRAKNARLHSELRG